MCVDKINNQLGPNQDMTMICNSLEKNKECGRKKLGQGETDRLESVASNTTFQFSTLVK